MIELIPTWFILVVCAATMLVNRAGASRVFFDVIGVFYGNRMLKDARAKFATLNALALDGLSGIEDAASMFGAKMAALTDDVVPIANTIADARIEFEKFVQSADDADKIAREVIDIGEGFGFAADQALMAAARMAQLSSVVGPDVIPAATQVGMEFGLIGGMGTEEAMTKLINLQQQTGFMLGEMTQEQFRAKDAEQQANIVRRNSIKTLDELNTIENRSAATMQHMTFVMNQFAAQAHLANESIAGMAAQSATLIEAGEEQGKAGRALKQIYARLGADTSGAASEIEALGVATRDSNGDMRALTKIVDELAPRYAELNGEQKTNLAIAVAGTHHYARFLKLMENNERTQQLMVEATLGLNPAMDEVNIRLDNQVTVLREAEARLEKYKGLLGDALTPSVIMATQVQAEYNKQLASIFSGSGGGLLNDLFGAAKVIQDTAAGFYQNFINIVQMNVALSTQRVLTAALRGEEMIREDFMATKLRGRIGLNSQINQELEIQKAAMGLAKPMIEDMLMTDRERLTANLGVSDALVDILEIGFQRQKGEHATLMTTLSVLDAEEAILQTKFSQARFEYEQQGVRQGIANRERIIAEDNFMAQQSNHQKLLDKRKKMTKEERKAGDAARRSSLNAVKNAEKVLVKAERRLDIEEAITLQMKEAHTNVRNDLQINSQKTEELKEQALVSEETLRNSAEELANTKAEVQIRRGMSRDAAEDTRQRQESTEMGKAAVAGQQLAMSMMAAGSAMMMFAGATSDAEEKQKRMRVAMILMNAAMVPQIFQMAKLTREMTGGGLATRLWTQKQYEANLAAFKGKIQMGGLSLSTQSVTASFHAATAATVRFAMATARALAPFAIMIAAGYAVTHLLEKYTNVFGDVEGLENAGAIASDFNDVLANNTKTIRQLADENQGYEQQLETIKNLEGAQYEERRRQLNDLILQNQLLIGTMSEQQFKENRNMVATAEQYFGALEKVADAEFRRNAEMEKSGLRSSRKFMDEQGLLIAQNQQLADSIREGSSEFAIFLREQNIYTLVEFNAAIQEGTLRWEEINGAIGDAANGTGAANAEIETATQLLDKFNNKREELFFGFKAGNLTGDLVRQIEQKGVENFVANTEIIMTNNFNGMTTDQVADEILRKINERAVTNGINVSPV